MNVSEITERVELPGGHAMIRMLSWKQRRDARDAASNAAVRLIADMGGDVMKALEGMDTGDRPERPEDPLQGLDQEKVLEFGVVGIHDNLDGQIYYPVVPPLPGANEDSGLDYSPLDNLSEQVAEKLAHAIVALSGRTRAEGEG
ncbi:MAG: hypothetical protein IIC29_08640 [Chloroflexi bacterium]|nr:hypothetical protein [Chloroflexota bacterium]